MENLKVGETFDTNSFGKLKIISKENSGRYKIKFYKTGYEKICLKAKILKGSVRDKYYPKVYGVGFIGEGKHNASINKKQTKEYHMWKNILQRCYCENQEIICPSYIGCEVDKRWHNFQNFCDDLQKLEGYDLWLQKTEKIEIDKDTKVKGNKVYGLEYCKFITKQENMASENKKQTTTGKTYLGVRKGDNYKELFYNIHSFSKIYGLGYQNVWSCLKKNRKSVKGWTFEDLGFVDEKNI